MGLSIGHLLLVLLIVLLLFGSKRLPEIVNDLMKGVKLFKEGLGDTKSTDKNQSSVTISEPSTQHSSPTMPPIKTVSETEQPLEFKDGEK